MGLPFIPDVFGACFRGGGGVLFRVMISEGNSCAEPRVCGLGLASAFGLGAEAHISGVRQGLQVLKPLKELWGAGHPGGDVRSGGIPERGMLCSRRNGPASQLALLLARQAVEEAGWGPHELEDAALVVGSSRGNASGWLSPWPGRRPMKILAVPNSLHSELASCVSIELGIHGPYHVLASGCAAGLDAVGMAGMLMRQGVVKRALAVGLDLPLCRELLGTYWASGMLSRNGVNDPYGSGADGMCISEGGAAVALEMSAEPGIHLRDYVVNSDAFSPLGMPPDGKRLAELLERVLKGWDGRVPLTVCPHASGTAGNALSERNALELVFGRDSLPDLRMMKPWTGHAIGGSGILELALMLAFVREGSLPPNPGWVSSPCGGAVPAAETALEGERLLVKSAASMGGHNVVLSLSVNA